MKSQTESRSQYVVIHGLIAYTGQGKGYAADPRILEKGAIIWADPDFWKDKRWAGQLVVRFLCDNAWFYVDQETFASSTRKMPAGP